MKKLIPFLFAIIAISLHAQNYQISFTGTGQSSTVDSVKIENLTQEISMTINGTDTLHLEAPVVGINALQTSNKLLIYPNPVYGNAIIEYYQQNESQIYIKLFDILGKVVLEKSYNLSEGKHIFGLSGLKKGTYIINIISTQEQFSSTIISLGTNNKATALSLTYDIVETTVTKKTNNTKSLYQMPYNDGEILMITAYSVNFSTTSTLIPTSDEVINSEFVACTDNNSNNYGAVTIGTQTWMNENLKATQFNDGTPVDYWNTGAWSTTSPAFTWYNETPFTGDSTGYVNTFGFLYNWYTVDSASNGNKNICPVGWHIPSDSEWLTLQNYLGGNTTSGSKIKESGNAHWMAPNNDATNESGFTGLPTGYRLWDGTFLNVGYYAYWWSKTADISNINFAWYFGCYYDSAGMDGTNFNKTSAYAIRCIKD